MYKSQEEYETGVLDAAQEYADEQSTCVRLKSVQS